MAVSNAQLSEKLDKLLEEVQGIRTDNAKRDAKYEEVKGLVDDHEKTLNGNGTGLKTRIALAEKAIEGMATWNKIMGGMLGAEILGIVFGLLTHTFTFNP